MEEKSKTVRVVCGIIEASGLILLARRAPGQALAGYWELPGGKIEDGETPPQALKRELYEELGIETEVLSRVGETQTDWKDGLLILEAWRVRIISGEPDATVHDKLVWVSAKEALDYHLAPADVPLMKNFLYKQEKRN